MLEAPYFQRSGIHHYEFREVVDETTLRRLLELRFAIYHQQSAASHLLPPDAASAMDADAHDTMSRFFGLFACTAEGSTAVGTLRVTDDIPSPALDALRSILAPHPALLARLHEVRTHAVPLMKYLIDREAIEHLIESIRTRGERFCEPGRLTLDPAHRTSAAGGDRHLARHVIDSAVAFYFYFVGIENAILTCTPPHHMLYRPYGFQEAEGTRTQYHEAVDALVACLRGHRDTVPSPTRERVETISRRIARTGIACRCASFPACMPVNSTGSPYETGEFRNTDVCCPSRAKELLMIADTAPGSGP